MLQRAYMRSSIGRVRALALSRHSDAFSDAWKLLKDFQWLPTTPRLTGSHLRLLYFDHIMCLMVYWFCWILFFFFCCYSLTQLMWAEQLLHGPLWMPFTLYIQYICSFEWARTSCSHLVPFVTAVAPHSKFTYVELAGKPAALLLKLHGRLSMGWGSHLLMAAELRGGRMLLWLSLYTSQEKQMGGNWVLW